MFFYTLTLPRPSSSLFFFNDTATTEIYTLSLHDALPISRAPQRTLNISDGVPEVSSPAVRGNRSKSLRSEEHTSELQSPDHLVCRLLLEKKKKKSSDSSIMRQHTSPQDVLHE